MVQPVGFSDRDFRGHPADGGGNPGDGDIPGTRCGLAGQDQHRARLVQTGQVDSSHLLIFVPAAFVALTNAPPLGVRRALTAAALGALEEVEILFFAAHSLPVADADLASAAASS